MERNNRNQFWVRRGHSAATAAWIIGQDVHASQDYLIHTEAPVFIAKIGHDPQEGVLAGMSYATSAGRSLYDFVWFGAIPNQRVFLRLMRDAEAILNDYLEFSGWGEVAR